MPERPPSPTAPGPPEPRSLGVLGGTFNPPHLGHLAIARHALTQLQLQRVALVPARRPPHKPIEQDPGCEHRLAMCRLLVAGCDGLSVCALEAERDGPSYTVDTLESIHASHPQAELTLIVGADIAATLASWHESQRLIELASLAVAERPGSDRSEVAKSLGALAERTRMSFLDAPAMDVSSSQVRRRAQAGAPIAGLVGDAVAGYVAEHGLYQARVQTASR
ncbi:MAG: nicotinate (nicotinamide) nucleotide adenylyltransferase [Solirubrobacteraceae bacterium]